MPAQPVMYVCDYPDCGRTFELTPDAQGYSFITMGAVFASAPIGSFNYPDDQQYCCCVNHMAALAKSNVDAIVSSLQAKAAGVGYTLQMDPPTA